MLQPNTRFVTPAGESALVSRVYNTGTVIDYDGTYSQDEDGSELTWVDYTLPEGLRDRVHSHCLGIRCL